MTDMIHLRLQGKHRGVIDGMIHLQGEHNFMIDRILLQSQHKSTYNI